MLRVFVEDNGENEKKCSFLQTKISINAEYDSYLMKHTYKVSLQLKMTVGNEMRSKTTHHLFTIQLNKINYLIIINNTK